MGSSSTNVGEEVDRISNLHDDIKFLIISRLPVAELVRTSVLSKKWKYSWKYVPRLDFDLMQMVKGLRSFFGPDHIYDLTSLLQMNDQITQELHIATRLVNSILTSHLATVTSCRISHFPLGSQEIVESAEYLTKKGIQELSLTGHHSRFHSDASQVNQFPFLSWGQTLHVLELGQCRLDNASAFSGCGTVKTLRLKYVVLDNVTLGEILAYCKALTELSLGRCVGVENLLICDKNLNILELRNMTFQSIKIEAESLAVLVLDKVKCYNRCWVEAPSVVKFEAYRVRKSEKARFSGVAEPFVVVEELLSHFSGILGSCSTFHAIPFKNLQMLSASLDLNNIREAIILSSFFQVCTCLKRLHIHSPVNEAHMNEDTKNHLSYPDYLFWDRKEAFESIANHLNVVWIKGFRGRDLEMAFAKYIITRAPNIKRITIDYDSKCSSAALSLLELQRASLTSSIFLNRTSTSSSSDTWESKRT